jgi:predicted kinase
LSKRLPRVIVLVGLPGSGKSTWAAREGLPTLSSDAMRVTLADDITDQTIHEKVFAALRYLIRQRVAIGRPVTCVDATHLTRWERRPYFRLKGCRVEAVYFDTPVAVCLRRNGRRGRVVPTAVIEAMAARLVKPAKAEGFTRVRVVRSGGR